MLMTKILISLYLIIGLVLFFVAQIQMGGVKYYYNLIVESFPEASKALFISRYLTAMIFVTLSWPAFLIEAILERKRK